MKVTVPLAKNILASLKITAVASAIGAGIQKKIHGFGTTTLIISNEEMNDIIKIVQALEYSNTLLKGVTKAVKNETREQKGGFLSMLLGTLGASLLGKMLAGKGIVRAGSRNKKGIRTVRAGYGRKGIFNVASSFKGCGRYIFASLFCMSKREYLRNKEKWFLFHFESSSPS